MSDRKAVFKLALEGQAMKPFRTVGAQTLEYFMPEK